MSIELTEREEEFVRHYRNPKKERFSDDGRLPALRVPYEIFKQLPYYTLEQLGIRGPDDYIPRWIGQYFVIRLKNGKEFLVNTECHRYCKYFASFVAS